VVDEAVARGCCGIQGDVWRRLVDDDARHALRKAAQTLRRLDCGPEEAALQTGASVEAIITQAAAEWNCDVVAAQIKRRPWSVGLSPRQADGIGMAQRLRVVALGNRR
jgi:hypothetical protein